MEKKIYKKKKKKTRKKKKKMKRKKKKKKLKKNEKNRKKKHPKIGWEPLLPVAHAHTRGSPIRVTSFPVKTPEKNGGKFNFRLRSHLVTSGQGRFR